MRTALIGFLLIGIAVSAQQGRLPTVTRGVLTLGQLERQLARATDPESRERLLADDFEERLCAAPGTPIPRADWLARQTSVSAEFQQEAVHDFNRTAIYSAMMVSDNTHEMLVDVWRNRDGNWKLAVRYRCPATGKKPLQEQVPKQY